MTLIKLFYILILYVGIDTSHLNTRKTRAQFFMFDFCQLILKYHVRFHLQLNVSYLCVCVNRDEFSKGRLLLYIYMKVKLHQRQQYFFSNLPSS
jgi:hypothetical protein